MYMGTITYLSGNVAGLHLLDYCTNDNVVNLLFEIKKSFHGVCGC